jgi:hypothetical protein
VNPFVETIRYWHTCRETHDQAFNLRWVSGASETCQRTMLTFYPNPNLRERAPPGANPRRNRTPHHQLHKENRTALDAFQLAAMVQWS